MKPRSSVTPEEGLRGKRIKLVLLGQKHRNRPAFTETYDMEIESVKGSLSIATIISESLREADKQTNIPADLLEMVVFRLCQDVKSPSEV
jgi:hypothetical protein